MFNPYSLLTGLSSLALAVFATSCGGVGAHHFPSLRAQRVLYQWHDDGGSEPVTVRISLADQIAEFKRGGREIGWCYVATGKESHATKAGTYKITEKIEDKYSNAYGWMEDMDGNVTNGDAKPSDKVPPGQRYVAAPMPYWMRLTSYGIGMHGGLIPEPGKPASHGCIRMPKEFVSTLFDAVSVGTPVTITNAPSEVPLPEVERHPPMENWSPYGRVQSVQSVTYRNGLPVSYQ